jgi:hypothetical protein
MLCALAEGFARGLLAVEQTTPPRATGRHPPRNRRRHAPSPVPDNAPHAVGYTNGARPAPTQAELDRIEAVLKGELPADSYMPGEGVPVTGPNP